MKPFKKPTLRDDPVIKELLKRLEKVAFGKDGLRIMPKWLGREEYDFKNVPIDLVPEVMEWEFQRELSPYYTGAALVLRGEYAKFKKTKAVLPWTVWSTLFPLSYNEITKLIGPTKIDLESLGAVTEIDQEWLDQGLKGANPDLSFHRIRLDWRMGSKAIQAELERWIIKMAKDHSPRRGRTYLKQCDDKLDQLAAWRAHRAGCDHDEFKRLEPRMPYSGASAYRTAWKEAEKAIKGELKALKTI